jgi:hypothetical protein
VTTSHEGNPAQVSARVVAYILGSVGFANADAYTASNRGVISLTRAAPLEYADRGSRRVSLF